MNILFAASEAFPFIKTGGLGDVVHSLPIELNKLGDDVRLVLPAYRDLMAGVEDKKVLATTEIRGVGVTHTVSFLSARSRDGIGELYLVDAPLLFDRAGNPYVDEDGHEWPDNAERFTVFCRAVAEMAAQVPGTDWSPDVVHCHDWQTGLVPAFISTIPDPPVTMFTIHNLSYDGYYSHHDFTQLALPATWWAADGIELYGGFSMLKAGIVFSDQVTTVSPTYAREICTPEFGYRYDGVLRHHSNKLHGILNGIDVDVWNPATDPHLAANYSTDRNRQNAKQHNKANLLERTDLAVDEEPLIGFIGRLVAQKGIDLMLAVIPDLFEQSTAKMIVLGTGDPSFEQGLKTLEKSYPDRLHVHIGYSETLAHKIEAGCDLFMMPSRFEPCGLNQMYSLRYGTPPLVNNTGGLADTVVDTTLTTLRDKTANGFVIDVLSAESLLETTLEALKLYASSRLWIQVCRTGMEMELGWTRSAEAYQELYRNTTRATA